MQLQRLSIASTLTALLVIAILHNCAKPKNISYASHFRADETAMIADLKRLKVKQPVELGIAVCKTKNPELMAAIAIKESSGDTKAIGDSGDSKGAFQVQEKHWSKVPATATEQALQAEKILEELVASSRGRLRSGLEKYNTGRVGTKAGKRYAADVLRIKRMLG